VSQHSGVGEVVPIKFVRVEESEVLVAQVATRTRTGPLFLLLIVAVGVQVELFVAELILEYLLSLVRQFVVLLGERFGPYRLEVFLVSIRLLGV